MYIYMHLVCRPRWPYEGLTISIYFRGFHDSFFSVYISFTIFYGDLASSVCFIKISHDK